nr:uncharacterized mitochondrial protein AtMg00810-like [Tanacetum cinerariifolium]
MLHPPTITPSMQTTHDAEEPATMPHDSPLPRVQSLGSVEGSLTLNELTVLYTKLSKRVEDLQSDLQQKKLTYGAAYTKLILRVKKLEHKVKTSQHRTRTRVVLSTDEEDLEDPSKQGRKIIEIDENPFISLGCKIAKWLQEAITEADSAYDIDWNDPAVLRYHALQNRSFSIAKVRKNMCMYLKNQGGYKQSHFKGMSYEDIRLIFKRVWDQIHAFVPMDSEIEKEDGSSSKPVGGSRKKIVAKKRIGAKLDEESAKRQKLKDVTEEEATVEYENEKEELRLSLKIIHNDDSEVNYEPLSRKFAILLRWKLRENYEVYALLMDGARMEINMLVEKKYPLIKELLKMMLILQLEAKEERIDQGSGSTLNVTFDETRPPSKTSPLVDDDLDEEEAIKVIEKKNLENDMADETLEIDEIVNIKESRNHPLKNVIGNLNQRTLRLVAQGYNQQEGIDYDETYAPVATLESIRILLAYACTLDFKLFQVDAKSAFLNGFINEEKFGLEDSKPMKTPMSSDLKLTKDEEYESVDSTKYRGMIAVKRIFRYIKGTTHLGLWYPKGTDIEPVLYADSDHAGDYVDRKSTSGICTFMGCCLTSWFSKEQTALAISTTEAEYVSARKACQ